MSSSRSKRQDDRDKEHRGSPLPLGVTAQPIIEEGSAHRHASLAATLAVPAGSVPGFSADGAGEKADDFLRGVISPLSLRVRGLSGP